MHSRSRDFLLRFILTNWSFSRNARDFFKPSERLYSARRWKKRRNEEKQKNGTEAAAPLLARRQRRSILITPRNIPQYTHQARPRDLFPLPCSKSTRCIIAFASSAFYSRFPPPNCSRNPVLLFPIYSSAVRLPRKPKTVIVQQESNNGRLS